MSISNILILVLFAFNVLMGIVSAIKSKNNEESSWLGWICSSMGWFVALLWFIEAAK